MSAPSSTLAETSVALDERPPSRFSRPRLAAVGALVVAVVAVIVVVTDPFGGGGAPGGGAVNDAGTSLQPVVRESLTEQSDQSGTLGFAGSATILLPGGTPSSSVARSQQSVAHDDSTLSSARASLVADEAKLADARATLSADRAKEEVDCAGDGSGSSGSGGGSGMCASDEQLVSSDQQGVASAAARVSGDRSMVSASEGAVVSAQASLSSSGSAEVFYGQGATYTELPHAGEDISRGQTLYVVGDQPVVLLYGSVLASRAFVAGMSPGSDVGELNANLAVLGYAPGLSGDAFTAGTAAGIRAFQSARGLSATGELLLGSVVFRPGAVRVTSVMATLGASAVSGPVLSVSSTGRQVVIALDAAQQGSVAVGDQVTITLPSNATTPGVVSFVGGVASTPQGGGSPTINVDVTPTDPTATGNLVAAPVTVSITTASVKDALVVPVDALLALSGGGYAIEVVGNDRIHHLVAVGLGLFDDASGLVQISGSGVSVGERVVVPSL